MGKRGLSTVVTSLIMILLVLVAVGVVWVVIKNIISGGVNEISLGKFTLDLKIKSVSIENGNVSVIIHRNAGEGEISEIQFVLTDGKNSEIIKQTSALLELKDETHILSPQKIFFIKEVSIVPVLKSESGKEIIGDVIDKKSFTEVESIKGIGGLVLYLPLEENTNDASGNGNDGNVSGGVNFVPGKTGNGANFDGVSGYINTKMENFANRTENFTVSFWVKAGSGNVNSDAIIEKWKNMGSYPFAFRWYSDKMQFARYDNSLSNSILSDNLLGTSDWHYIVGSYNGTTMVLYMDGTSKLIPVTINPISNNNSIYFGSRGGITGTFFNGTLDELIIFNKSLSGAEINSLYEYSK